MINFRIKICGITNARDARQAVEYGADAVGLNFYSRSLRSVSVEKARSIVDAIPTGVSRIGVFVNENAENIIKMAEQLRLDAVQLHGDESIDLVAKLTTPVIRAVRVMNQDFEVADVELSRWHAADVSAVLLDAASTKEYGGTGQRLDWEAISARSYSGPFVLAGGLNMDNVGQAIRICKPMAVDVASGIEKFPGVKDHDLMRLFIENATRAFASLA